MRASVDKYIGVAVVVAAVALAVPASAYPPAVGILGRSENCLACHVNNGPWTDEGKTLIDVLDKETGESLRQDDGSFLIEAKRGQARTVLTVIGRTKDDTAPAPYRNAWIYVAPAERDNGSPSSAKFAPSWAVNLPMACRIVGDEMEGFEGARITALPMTVRPLDGARDAELELQVMLTRGESVKGDPAKGMKGNCFERTVLLRVMDD
ncbi:MAG TPA: hypothetical protein QGH10_09340 [Armatimonadota bacterium]|nr:hypothetical protein [Armatimonadota bacterium]